MRPIIAIDPGASGGIAWMSCFDGRVEAVKMPEGLSEQGHFIRKIALSDGVSGCSVRCVLEKVGSYMPGNSGPASCKFARHCGHLEAILYMRDIPVIEVTPHKWQKHLATFPKDKQERKRAIKEMMARRYPHLKVTLATADALGILTWAIEKAVVS